MQSFRFCWLLVALLCGLAGTRARAQSGSTATITTTIQNEADVPLLGASLVVLHLPTGLRRVAISDEHGQCRIDALLSGGPYVLQIIQPGFRAQVVTNMYLRAGGPVNLDFRMVPDAIVEGARRTNRTAANAPGPANVTDVRNQGLSFAYSDLPQALHYPVPSPNPPRQTTANRADHIESNSLRGLAPDQLLVPVNGKRQYPTALPTPPGNRSRAAWATI